MPNFVFRFPAGRYHATPWGNHVNEGLVEWPPSPWRILRALVATGFSKLGWVEVPPAAREIVEALAESPPEYHLPPATAAHTRHFMPTDSPKPEARTKVFDAFAHIGKEAVVGVSWPADLSPSAEALLAELVPRLSYLGRAESVVVASLVDASGLPAGTLASSGGVNRPGVEPITLLAPMTSTEYAAWLAVAAPPSSADTGKKPKGKKPKPGPFPPDALSALLVDTAFLQEHGWTQPPGSRRVLYHRAPLTTSQEPAPRRAVAAPPADTALLALASDTRNHEVLPPRSRALILAETLHRGLLAKLDGARCPEITGRDDAGSPMKDHQHAHVLALDLDDDGRIDHLLVHAGMGLGAVAQQALRATRAIYGKEGRLFVTLAGLGKLGDFVRLGIHELTESRSWISATPFVPARHLKAGRHTLDEQIQAELAWHGKPRARAIEVLDRPWLIAHDFHRFTRSRREPGRGPPAPVFFGLRIELERPTPGPLALGYGSHFGLGLFTPQR